MLSLWDGSDLDTSTGFTSTTWAGRPTQVISNVTYPAASWLLGFNLPYDTSLNQDINSDGVTLLMAYALNLNPNERLTTSLPVAELDSTTLSIKYYAGSTGLTYRAETCEDLETWVTTGVTISAPDSNDIVTASIPRDDGSGFLRLVVIEN